MPENQKQKARRLFMALADLAVSERSAALERACGADAALRAEVEALLRADAAAGDFMASPTSTVPPAVVSAATLSREQAGAQIGRYKLLEQIGEGGMGTIWMAEQREPVKRRVALKIIKLGMDTKQVIARFEAERQALAMMDHPHIARVLDAGATDAGRPYFVMEYIKGIPILEYCDQEKVDTKSRLELFTAVCQAIQHAHQKGIIHRDIKPSNVLVTLHDGVPVPKVIDFGIAKATNSELTTKTLFTEHRQMVGTPAYMSPEQAEMSGLDIDTRSDIYSLGVLLYELLTGTTPFDVRELMAKGFGEMMRTIREDEPHKPSTRISSLGDTGTRTALQRNVDAKRLSSLLRGDIDWIVMKCLEKDRSRRYETANGLAADIKRHLNDEPVTAGAPSAGYRLRKFLKRNRGKVIAAGIVAAALVLGVIGTTTGMMRAIAERQRADEQTRKATLAAESETKAKVAALANEQAAVQQAMLALKTMQIVVTDVDSKLAAQPGTAELRIGMLQKIEKQWDELDLSLAGGVKGEAIPTLMAVRGRIASSWVTLGRIGEADAQYERLHAMARSRVIEKDRNDASRHNLALICVRWSPVKARRSGNPADAQTLLDEALGLLQEIGRDPRPAPGSPRPFEIADTLQHALLSAASHAIQRGDVAKAEAAYTEAGATCESQLQAMDAGASWFVEFALDRQQQLRRYFQQNLELSRAGRANCLMRLGRTDEAVAIYRAILERSRAAVAAAPEDGSGRSQLATLLRNFGQQMIRVGRFDDGATVIAEARDLTEVLHQADPMDAHRKKQHAYSAYYLGVARDGQGRGDEARQLFEASRRLREALVEASPDKSNKVDLMLALARAGQVEGAQALANELSASPDKDPDLRLDVARAMAQLARHTEEPTRATFRAAAFAALSRCVDDGLLDPYGIASEADLAPLREDPRFAAILARLVPVGEGKR
jgi:tRNA A-37 threonylcarbamoyl transferase component Bud32/tetratricopeptide (TPR) repeat protein